MKDFLGVANVPSLLRKSLYVTALLAKKAKH